MNQRVLNISVNSEGQVGITGDEFTVGELSQLGEQIVKIAQSQKIKFAGGENESSGDKERPAE